MEQAPDGSAFSRAHTASFCGEDMRDHIAISSRVRWQPVQHVRLAVRDAAQDLADYADFLILMFFRLPVMLLWVLTLAVLAALGWKLGRWLWRKLFVPSPVMA